MEYFKFLPEEITLNILTRVPTESALECKFVCKTWRNLVGYPSFSKMHLHHHLNHPASADSGKFGFIAMSIGNAVTGDNKIHYFEYDENHETTPIERIKRVNITCLFKRIGVLLGSSNGLVFLSKCSSYTGDSNISVCICNPITKEYVVLPDIKKKELGVINQYVIWLIGFGYVSAVDEYKVVVIYMSKNQQFIEIYVYTLGSGNGWRKLGEFSTKIRIYRCSIPVVANEALHWKDNESEMIVTFNLAEEKLYENHSLPPLPPTGKWSRNRIGVFCGVLFFGVYVEGDECLEIWLLEKKNDNHDMKEGEEHLSLVWSKKFMVDYDESLFLFATKSECVLTYDWCRCLNLYDTKASTSRRLMHLKERFCQVFAHNNTFVSLKELGEEDIKIMESVEVEEIESPGLAEDEADACIPLNCTSDLTLFRKQELLFRSCSTSGSEDF